jgi:Type II secretion system (T2SS), protein E, N-terminal domain
MGLYEYDRAAALGFPTYEDAPPPAPDDDGPPPAAELPYVDLRSFPLDRDAARLISAEVARFYSALPYGFESGVPLVALADATATAILSLRLAIGCEPRFARASRLDLAAAIAEAYSDTAEVERLALLVPAPRAESLRKFRVIVRLHGSESVDAGVFEGVDAAKDRAVEIADQITGVEGSWPFVHGRFLRPESVASVDIVEEAA